MTYKTLLGYTSFDALPQTLFANSGILRLMGFNAFQIRTGFNQKGVIRPFDPETLSEFFQRFTQTTYLRWSADLVRLWRRRKLLSGTFLFDCISFTTKSDRYEKISQNRSARARCSAKATRWPVGRISCPITICLSWRRWSFRSVWLTWCAARS